MSASGVILLLAVMLYCIFPGASEAFALSKSHYASSSALAEGRWVKVKVASTGLQFVSTSTLRSMGFSDIEKINVYGFGGRQLPDLFTAEDSDDLPLLPSVRTSRGIYFFGHNHILWKKTSLSQANLAMSHTMNPYSEESWYFLSDRDMDSHDIQPANTPQPGEGMERINSFNQMLLHEQELTHPGTSGNIYVGEDFRSPSTRSFTFNLKDKSDNGVRAKVSFASNTSAMSSLLFTANGTRLAATSSDQLPAVTSSDQFMQLRTTVKSFDVTSENLKFDITFQNSGTLSLARLDYIEIEYRRRLRLSDGQLFFYSDSAQPALMVIEGAENATIIWDVTDPAIPLRVDFTLKGSQASFVTPAGQREYIAFTPDKGGYALTEFSKVDNQDIHSLPVPDMLIISPTQYLEAANRLAAHHRDFDGFKVHVLTPEAIYNEFSSATPDVGAFRRLLKMWYDRMINTNSDENESSDGRLRYCLIMSRPTYDPKLKMETTKAAGYPRIPIWQSSTGFSKNTSYSTDDYIAMLDDATNFNIATAKIRLGVGRMPVTSLAEANEMVDKYIAYSASPDLGDWRNHIMFIADDQDNGVHFDQAQDAYNNISKIGRGGNYLYDRVYLDSYPIESSATGETYPEAKKRMLRLWNEGLAMIHYIGHASTVGWGHEDLLNWTDITNMSNSIPAFLYAATCEFARWDEDSRCGAEILWSKPQGGIIATICPSRTVFITPNGEMSTATAKVLFLTDKPAEGRRIGDVYMDAKNSFSASDDNKLRFILMGNPAMRFPVPKYRVVVDSIDQTEILTAETLPTLPARSRAILKGRITDDDGIINDDFNGKVSIMLYDAESVIETLGNGASGQVRYYNDRRTLLYRGVSNVMNGEWETTVMLPAEITNNYSPARFTFYASSENGMEAHGQSTSLYVYGYDSEAPDDNEGPSIHLFAINREDYQEGDAVHSSPVVLAKISDPSGINLSDAGIGHKMALTLDSKKYYDDVNSYFEPDSDDPTAGSLMYPLLDLEAGEHSLKFTVWDNANNSSSASIKFNVAVAKKPEIYNLTTDVNPARDKVNFLISTDRPMSKVDCMVEVFDLNGNRVWNSNRTSSTDILAGLTIGWDLNDNGGQRVSRGIYLYRATITSDSGVSTTASRKLAVTAP